MIYFNLIVDSWFLIPLSNLFCFQLSLFSPDDMTIERALEFWFPPEDILCVEKSRLPCACLRKCLRGIVSCTAMNNACLPMNVSFLCLPIAKKFILFNNELLLTMLFESFPKWCCRFDMYSILQRGQLYQWNLFFSVTVSISSRHKSLFSLSNHANLL